MSRNALLDNISQSYIKNFMSKNTSKISETPLTLYTSSKAIKANEAKKIKINHINSSSISKYLNDSSLYVRKERKPNPLITVYNNGYYPRSLKNKNYIKEISKCLPPISFNNDDTSNKIIITDYESSVNKFNNIYKSTGDELEYSKESGDEELINEIKKNRINYNETNYIDSILKDNQKQNLCITLRSKEEFVSPKNSLQTLKVNKALLKNISHTISKYQYQSYAKKINDRQTYKLKLCLQPKAIIKDLKYHLEQKRQQQQQNETKKDNLKDSTNKIATLDKNLINKITRKYSVDQGRGGGDMDTNLNDKRKKSKSDIFLKITEQNMAEGDKKIAINSTLIRNSLIEYVNLYYCKYLMKGIVSPNSRMEATFTPYHNNLYLFGGLQTNEVSDLWVFDVGNKDYNWKKIIYQNEISFNPRYGHTTVAFNDCLYIYGGKFNLKRLKYPLEDILVYNIPANLMKIGTFKNEKNKYNQKYIYIPMRRNHIAHVIGWNMIVHGGIDISKEYVKDNLQEYFDNDDNFNKRNIDVKINENVNNYILGDFMALDLLTLKWMQLTNIVVKKKYSKKRLFHFDGLPRVYHSSCLVLSSQHLFQGNKLNIYKKDAKISEDNIYMQNVESKNSLNIKYEGIYIFGGLDENYKETNNLFILHCFRNPLVLLEPKISGKPPSPRQMATMNYNKILNYITLYGGKSINRVFGDLFILDIMNFQWLNVQLFGASISKGIVGHCAGIINDKLYIFGGCDETNKYTQAKLLCVELDLFRNKKLSKIFEYAQAVLEKNPKDKTSKNVIDLIKGGVDLPPDIYPFLQLDN